MKFKTVLTYAALSTLLLSGCGLIPDKGVDTPKPNQSKQTEAVQQKNTDAISFEGITFNVPSTAKKADIPDIGIPAIAFLLANDGTNFNVVVDSLPTGMGMDEYIEAATANTGFEYLSKKNVQLNNLEWNESISMNQGLKQNQKTLLHDGKAYVFTYAGKPDTYDTHIASFENIINSVQTGESNSIAEETNATESLSMEDSEDPVYQAMMDPNTELGKIFNQILESEKQLNEDTKRRVEKVKQNLIEIAEEKQQLQEQLTSAEQELSTLKDEKQKTWKKEEINLLKQKIQNKDAQILEQKELLETFLN